MRKLFTVTAAAAIIFAACNSGSNPDAMSRDERLKIIKGIEEESFGEKGSFDVGKAILLTKHYALFAEENPDDELAPEYLFKAGDIAMGLEKPELAISYFDTISSRYPEFEKVPYCLFLRAFIYENQLQDLEKARTGYEDFLSKYPDHEMSESARFSLKNLGKSPEELIREFEGQQDSTQEES